MLWTSIKSNYLHTLRTCFLQKTTICTLTRVCPTLTTKTFGDVPRDADGECFSWSLRTCRSSRSSPTGAQTSAVICWLLDCRTQTSKAMFKQREGHCTGGGAFLLETFPLYRLPIIISQKTVLFEYAAADLGFHGSTEPEARFFVLGQFSFLTTSTKTQAVL